MDWFRSYHGAPTDPKWIVIANKANSKPGVVAAIWWYLMDMASQARVRGDVSAFDPEVCAAAFGWSEDEVVRVFDALRAKQLISAESILTAWVERNPDDYSTDRVRRFRQKVKQDETEGNAGNADEKRVEEKEIKDEPLAPDGEETDEIRGQFATLIRKHFWIAEKPPLRFKDWNMGREISIGRQWAKGYGGWPVVLAIIPLFRKVLGIPEDVPISCVTFNAKEGRHKLNQVIGHYERQQAIDATRNTNSFKLKLGA
jgi:hypothetical protein